MAVRRCALSSSGETTTHGRVFLISLPSVGSNRTKWTSPRVITTSSPSGRTALAFQRPATHRRLAPASRERPRPNLHAGASPHSPRAGPVLLAVPLRPEDSPDRAAVSARGCLGSCQCGQFVSSRPCAYSVARMTDRAIPVQRSSMSFMRHVNFCDEYPCRGAHPNPGVGPLIAVLGGCPCVAASVPQCGGNRQLLWRVAIRDESSPSLLKNPQESTTKVV